MVEGQPPQPEKKHDAAPQESTERNIRFQFNGIPYADVIRRFSQMTGKPILGDVKIDGTVTFTDPKPYTSAEALDTLNLILAMKGAVLVETDRYLRLASSADLPQLPLKIFRGLDAAEDVRPGEVVTVVLPVRYSDPGETAQAASKMLSGAGSISALKSGEGIVITDRLDSIERIKKLVVEIDVETTKRRLLKTYRLVNASGPVLADMVNKTLGSTTAPLKSVFAKGGWQTAPPNPEDYVTTSFDQPTGTLVLFGPPAGIKLAEELIATFEKEGEGAGELAIIYPRILKATDLARMIREGVSGIAASGEVSATSMSKARLIVDSSTNRIIISAPVPGQIGRIKEFVDTVDTIEGGDPRQTPAYRISTTRVLRIAHAEPERLATILREATSERDPRGNVRHRLDVQVLPQSRTLIVSGSPGDVQRAEKIVADLEAARPKEQPRLTRVFEVGRQRDAGQLAQLLEKTYAARLEGDPTPGTIRATIAADPESGTIIVTASQDHLAIVESLLVELGRLREAPEARLLTLVPVKAKIPSELVPILQSVLDEGRKGKPGAVDASIIADDAAKRLIVLATPADHARVAELVQQLDNGAPVPADRETRALPVAGGDVERLVSIVERLYAAETAGTSSPGGPAIVVADAPGNRLLVTGTSAEIDRVERIVREADPKIRPSVPETRVFRLSTALARDILPVLKNTLSTDSGIDGADTLRLSADTASNSIVVIGQAALVAAAAEIVAGLDVGQDQQPRELRVVQLKTGNSSGVRGVVEELLTTRMRELRGPAYVVRAKVLEHAARNRLILTAPKDEMAELNSIVDVINTASPKEEETRTFKLENVDATKVASALSRSMNTRDSRGRTIERVRIASDSETNSIIATGPPDLIETVATFVARIESSGPEPRQIELIEPNARSATELAPLVSSAYQEQSRGRIGEKATIKADAAANRLIVFATEGEVEVIRQIVEKLDAGKALAPRQTKTFQFVNSQEVTRVARLAQEVMRAETANDTRGSSDPPVFLADAPAHRLLVTGSTETLERVTKVIEKVRQGPPPPVVVQRHTASFDAGSGANEFGSLVSRLYTAQLEGQPDPIGGRATIVADAESDRLLVTGPQSEIDRVAALVGQLTASDTKQRVFQAVRLNKARAEALADAVNNVLNARDDSSQERVTITPEPNSNSLLVDGDADAVREVIAIIRDLDKKSAETGAPELRKFKVENGDVEAVASTLKRLLDQLVEQQTALSPGMREPPLTITPDGRSRSLYVWSTAPYFRMVERLLVDLDEPETSDRSVRYLSLHNIEAYKVASQIEAMYANRDKDERPVVETDYLSNTLTAIGREADLAAISQLVDKLDAAAAASEVEVRVLPISQLPAGDVARLVKRIYSQLSDNEIEITDRLPRSREETKPTPAAPPKDPPKKPEPAKKPDPPKTPEPPKKEGVDGAKGDPGDAGDAGEEGKPESEAASNGGGAQEQQEQQPPRRPKIIIAVEKDSNSILLSGPRRELEEIEALIRKLSLNALTTETDYRVFKIANTDPRTVARNLEELYNPKDRRDSGGRNDRRPPKIAVVTDQRARAVIVRARPEEFVVIERIIEQLDAPSEREFLQAEVKIVPLQKANAARLATVLREMLKPSEGGSATPEARSLQEQVRLLSVRNGSGLPVTLDLTKPIKIVADPPSAGQTGGNRLILSSTPDNLLALEAVVQMMDTVPVVPGIAVRLARLEHADAASVQATLTTIFEQGQQLGSGPGGAGEPVDESGRALVNTLNVATDRRTNTLIMSGQPATVALALGLVADLDKETEPFVTEVRLFQLRYASALRMAPLLRSVFAESSPTPGAEGLSTQVSRLVTVLSPSDQPATDLPKTRSALTIQADDTTNTLIVAARRDTMPLIKDVISTMDIPAASGLGTVRIYPLEQADATSVRAIINNLYSGPNASRVRNEDRAVVTVDTRTNALVVSGNETAFSFITSLLFQLDRDQKPAIAYEVFPLTHNTATQVASSLQQFFSARTKGSGTVGAQAQVSVATDVLTNSLLISANAANMEIVKRLLVNLDVASTVAGRTFRIFELKNTTATKLRDTLQRLFTNRPRRQGGPRPQPVTFVADSWTNALIASGMPLDLEGVTSLVDRLDVEFPTDGSAIDVIPLSKANARSVASTIESLYRTSTTSSTASSVTITVDERMNALVVSAGEADLKRITGLARKLDSGQVGRVSEIRIFPLVHARAVELARILTETLNASPGTTGTAASQTLLQFMGRSHETDGDVKSALQENVLFTPDTRTNSLVVSAPVENLPLLEEIISELDESSPQLANIEIFELRNADARRMAGILSDLFRLQRVGFEGTAYGVPGGGQVAGAGAARAVQYRLPEPGQTDAEGEQTGDGDSSDTETVTVGTADLASLVVTVDPRTNSIIVGGTKHYVSLARDLIKKLDESPARERQTRVYRLRNAQAADVETALTSFLALAREAAVQPVGGAAGSEGVGTSVEKQLEEEVAIVGEPTTNTLLLSASPRYFDELSGLIEELDAPQPQVLIQTLIAEVTLDDAVELGVEWRYTGEIDGRDVEVGSDFGIADGIAQFGGLSASLTGGDINVILRALQQDGRAEVLSRPQLLAGDNVAAEISIGQSVPQVTGSQTTDNGNINNTISYREVGVILRVTPRISVDGYVRLEVEPELSSLSDSTVDFGTGGGSAPIFNERKAHTTVTVKDGHTIVIGGLISTSDAIREEKVPILGDIPFFGIPFRSRKVSKRRTELLIVLTPTIIRNFSEADRVTEENIQNSGIQDAPRRDKTQKFLLEEFERGAHQEIKEDPRETEAGVKK